MARDERERQGAYQYWLYTSFEEDDVKFDESIMSYQVSQRERCPDTQRLHWQGYIEFKLRMRRSRVKIVLQDNKLHLENRKGTQADAIRYCTKNDTQVSAPIEQGSKGVSRQGRRTDLSGLLDAVGEDRSEYDIATDPELAPVYARHMRYFSRLQFLRNARAQEPYRILEVQWYYGPPGYGKSRRAMWEAARACEGVYRKPCGTRWWDGYDGQDGIVIDDLDGADGLSMRQWKLWLDGYPDVGETKGGHVHFRYKRVWVTSNLSPVEWVESITDVPVHRDALLRRITKATRFLSEWKPPPEHEEPVLEDVESDSDSDGSDDTSEEGSDDEVIDLCDMSPGEE